MTRFSLARLRTIWRDRRGNVLMLFGFAVMPMTIAVGMGVDYARAMKSQTKLNALADAAALVAVSKPMMSLTDQAAAMYARNVFIAQARSVLGAGAVDITNVTATAPRDANGQRTATVRYTATSGNVFARLLGVRVLNIGGSSMTTNATAPNMNFYVLLDVSGSMALPTTSAGLRKIAQSNSRGCQFACHSTDDLTGTDAHGNQTSLYNVAKSYGLTLRVDEEATAVARLTQTATETGSRNGALYQMSVASFRGKGGFSLLQSLTPKLELATHALDHIAPSLFAKNGCPTLLCSGDEVGFNDQDSAQSDAFDQMNGLIKVPVAGANGRPTKTVMFMITDGMRDEHRPGGAPEVEIETAKCEAIKARGVRIAVLYTEYLRESLDNDDWSQRYVAPYLYKVEPALQACASDGLYAKVTTDGDISAALEALFQKSVATARIVK